MAGLQEPTESLVATERGVRSRVDEVSLERRFLSYLKRAGIRYFRIDACTSPPTLSLWFPYLAPAEVLRIVGEFCAERGSFSVGHAHCEAGTWFVGLSEPDSEQGMLLLRLRGMGPNKLLRALVSEQAPVWRRLLRPDGFVIALVGPDGIGKSSVIERLADELSPCFKGFTKWHVLAIKPRQRASRWVGLFPLGRANWVTNASRFTCAWVSCVAGNIVRVWPRRVAGHLVIFDRYYTYDVLGDGRKYGQQRQPVWLRRLGCLLAPKPDLVVVLDASAEVVRGRKPELTVDDIRRRRTGYRSLAGVRRVALIDASSRLEDTVAKIEEHVAALLAAREHPSSLT